MSHKYLAFDIETAKVLPDNINDLNSHRPLGITCSAIWCTDENKPEVFYSKTSDGSPAPQMSEKDLTSLIKYLKKKVNSGYTIITHNGLGFDFNILAEESNDFPTCRNLALQHVDMMFHFFCGKGFPISLNAAAEAIGLSKPTDIDGAIAPTLWKEEKYQKVLDYVVQDCRLTLDIAEKSEQKRRISWITQRGKKSHFELPSGWLTVEQASELPLPDTSWMDNPWPRSKFTKWLK